ncbi:hypothetical protein DVH24_000970 [Malus domestica]|uniref:Uncharacterized protein n=1 Tax=Malus domestica TaxID=3750 RepID=A0A498JZX9_MALDO|nr:hypothetical protein DVH24_000970 [Malus domestica]
MSVALELLFYLNLRTLNFPLAPRSLGGFQNFKCSIGSTIFGKFSSSEHEERSSTSRYFNLQMLFGIYESLSQAYSSSLSRAGRNSIDECSSLTAVLLKFKDFKCSFDSKISGKFSSTKHEERSSTSRNFNLQMLFGILESLLQACSSSLSRAGRNSIDECSSLTAVLLKFKDFKCSFDSKISGKFSSTKHEERSSTSRNFNLQMLFGILESLLQACSSSLSRARRNSIDECSSLTTVLLKFKDFKCSIVSQMLKIYKERSWMRLKFPFFLFTPRVRRCIEIFLRVLGRET